MVSETAATLCLLSACSATCFMTSSGVPPRAFQLHAEPATLQPNSYAMSSSSSGSVPGGHPGPRLQPPYQLVGMIATDSSGPTRPATFDRPLGSGSARE